MAKAKGKSAIRSWIIGYLCDPPGHDAAEMEELHQAVFEAMLKKQMDVFDSLGPDEILKGFVDQAREHGVLPPK